MPDRRATHVPTQTLHAPALGAEIVTCTLSQTAANDPVNAVNLSHACEHSMLMHAMHNALMLGLSEPAWEPQSVSQLHSPCFSI